MFYTINLSGANLIEVGEKMVVKLYYKCSICGCHIGLRYQIGYFDIPVNIYCPNCNTHISGIIQIKGKNENQLKNVVPISHFSDGYTLELATEFLIKKYKKGFMIDLTPFLRSDPFDDERNKIRIRIMFLAKNYSNASCVIENIYNLLKNNQLELLKKYLKNQAEPGGLFFEEKKLLNDVINPLDFLMITKKYIMNILDASITSNTHKVINEIIDNTKKIFIKNTRSTKDFLKFLNENNYFDIYFNKIPEYIVKYLSKINQLIPIYQCYETFNNVNLEEEGISTLSIEDMHELYTKGYEIICDSVDVLFGLNNMENRVSYDIFSDGRANFSEKLNGYGSKYNKYLAVAKLDTKFSKEFINLLENIIRNSNAHNSMSFDGLNQVITFVDKNKGKSRKRNMYFLEFGKKIIEIYSSILYLWEYYYQSLKNKYLVLDKLTPNYCLRQVRERKII